MSTSAGYTFKCGSCGRTYEAPVYSFIDAGADAGLRERVLDGSAFVRECPFCGHRELISSPMVYKEEGLLLVLSPRPVSIEGLDGSVGRRVEDAGSLIEKVRIFDAGLEDTAVEFCKFVTRNELGKDVTLRFVRLHGPDNEMIFTYPDGGQMQMLSVGFNVYEDCRAIIARNPVIAQTLSGLPCVDAAWVEQFMR